MSNSYGGPGLDRSEKIALTNVRVFDGRELRGPTTVVIEGGFVGRDSAGARITDAGGATVLPGFIDAHVHLLNEEHLQQLADFGVTTALDMGAWPPSMVDSLRNRTGMADIRSAGLPATRCPTLIGWNPSGSFSGTIASRTRRQSTCFGSGIWTRIPSISGRRLSSSIMFSNSSVLTDSGGVSFSL